MPQWCSVLPEGVLQAAWHVACLYRVNGAWHVACLYRVNGAWRVACLYRVNGAET